LHFLELSSDCRIVLHGFDSGEFLFLDHKHGVFSDLGSGISSGIGILDSDKVLVHISDLAIS
jgi:hypothetical protein